MQVAGADPRLAMWVGLEGGEPRSLLLVTLPFDPLTDWPMIDLGANRGSWALAQATVQAGIDFLHAAGYNQALLLNFSGRSDKLYIRAGTRVGLNMKPRATMMEVNF